MGCLKRKRGRTYVTVGLAKAEARAYHAATGVEIFIYRCMESPCDGRALHWTSKAPDSASTRLLNKALLNHYAAEKIRGTSEGRSRATHERRKRVRRQLPYLVWEDEGGALRPE